MASTARDHLGLLRGYFKLRRQTGNWESLAKQVSIISDSQGRYAREDGDLEEAQMWDNLQNAVYAVSWGSQTGRLSGEAERALRAMTDAQFLRLLAKVASERGPIQTMLEGFKSVLYKQGASASRVLMAHRLVARRSALAASRAFYGLRARPYLPGSTQPPGEAVLVEFRDMFQKGTPRAKRLPSSRVSVFAIVGYPQALDPFEAERYSLLEIPPRVAKQMAQDPLVDPYD